MKEAIRLVRHPDPSGEDKVCLLVNGKLVADLPYQVAMSLGLQLISLSKQIENDTDPERQILDQAILMRAGVNIGLSDNPDVLREAYKSAQWDKDLRRYMPNAPGIKSSEVVGIPTVTVGNKQCLKH